MTTVRIGARGSRLSRAQAGQMQARITAALGAPPEDADKVAPLVFITTTGDRIQDRRLLEVGGKALFIAPSQGSENGVAIALGAHFHYVWPSYNRFAIGGELYYAPSIVSFNHADRYMEFGVRAGYSVLRNAEIYVGYRHVAAAFTSSSTVTLDNTFMVGLSLTF